MRDKWTYILLGVVAAWMIWSKQRYKVSLDEARDYLKQGALVLDVRTEREFESNHLPGAVNLPGHELADRMAALEADKQRVILCHCLSGTRSSSAVSRLRKLGYSQAYNLGSYRRAASLLKPGG